MDAFMGQPIIHAHPEMDSERGGGSYGLGNQIEIVTFSNASLRLCLASTENFA